MTTPVYLIRHAKAESRTRWMEPDHLRPLTKAGRRQAKALTTLFEAQPFSRLLSSPYLRFVQTLEPLAETRGLPLETADELSEGAPVNAALALIISTAADGPAALCTHGDVMRLAVEGLVAAEVPIEGPLELKKGATWILEVDGSAVARARYLPAPAKRRR
ncbi:MAG: phosphoglycerate mutase family protein [Gaiellaceae bacterium]